MSGQGDITSSFRNLFPNIRRGESSSNPPSRSTSYALDGTQQAPPAPSPVPEDASTLSLDAQSNLLGLLRFSSAASPQTTSHNVSAVESPRPSLLTSDGVHGRGLSASDLVANLRASSGPKSSTPPRTAPRSSSASHQHSLLKILNATTAGSSEERSHNTPSPAGRDSPPVRVFGSKEATPTPFEPQAAPSTSAANPGLFTYVNPFEQLAASSPLKLDHPEPATHKRSKPNDTSGPRKHKSPSPLLNQPLASGLTASGDQILKSIEGPPSDSEKENRTEREALMNIGAPSKDAETVADALNEVGQKVHSQMEAALTDAEEQLLSIRTVKNEGYHEETSVPPLSTAGTTTVSAIDGPDAHEGDLGVTTYSIPMRPFLAIDIKKTEAGIPLRAENMVNIARFKKEFDQVDRTLVIASKEFIVYGIPKPGGIRVIHQDNGISKVALGGFHDRIFHVAITKPMKDSGIQCLVGTGVTGTVYWTTLSEDGEHDMDRQALVIPPVPTVNESASTGQLKTRVKRSSRSPDVIAIGRGKSIQIVFPFHARQSRFMDGNVLDTERYFADRSLKVNPGKAGKDFVFSEDDTVIATLDKHGKVRLWDIRDLVHPDNGTASILAPIEVKTPVLTYNIGHAAEKVWPTSVQFVDKLKSYQKGIAQRYVLVGMKQNHMLQLFDLTLDKIIQEVYFPHENESDAICSVCFHPETSLIVVGHPTRNSIYVIQLSAPKYHLPSLSQAKLVARVANKDPGLPKTESTAVMNGFREYSLGDIGQLRSLSLTPPYGEAAKPTEGSVTTDLFELYVMHSKGVTCLSFKKQDIGWSPAGKVLHSVDAVESGTVELREFKGTPPSTVANGSVNGEAKDVTTQKGPSKHKDLEKADRKAAPSPTPAKPSDKKKSRQEASASSVLKPNTESSAPTVPTPSNSRVSPALASTKTADTHASEKPSVPDTRESVTTSGDSKPLSNGEVTSPSISSELLDQGMKKIEQGLVAAFDKSFQRELAALSGRLDSDKRVSNAQVHANQEAILRLVSQQLGDNVERSLSNIVSTAIKEHVKPTISGTTGNILEKSLPHVLGQQLEHLLPLHLKPTVTEAVRATLSKTDILRLVSDQVSTVVKQSIERDFSVTLSKTILPQFQQISIGAAQKASSDTENRIRAQLQQAEAQRREDSAKIDQLSTSVRVLSETIHHMAEAQSAFQQEILRLQESRISDEQNPGRKGSPTPSESASVRVSPEQREIDEVADMMQKGKYEDATIMWLQSPQQINMFDRIFSRYDPGYLRQCPPLVVLSVGAAVSGSLEQNLAQRLGWTEFALRLIDVNHPDTRQVVRKVTDFIAQRLSASYMTLSESNPNNQLLRRIAALTHFARDMASRSPPTPPE